MSVTTTATVVRVVHDSVCPDIGPICDVRPEPPQIHDQRFYVTELRPVVEYGITNWLSAELQLPLKLSKTTIKYRTLEGASYNPDYQPIHHRNETLVGLGDPWQLRGHSIGNGAVLGVDPREQLGNLELVEVHGTRVTLLRGKPRELVEAGAIVHVAPAC